MEQTSENGADKALRNVRFMAIELPELEETKANFDNVPFPSNAIIYNAQRCGVAPKVIGLLSDANATFVQATANIEKLGDFVGHMQVANPAVVVRLELLSPHVDQFREQFYSARMAALSEGNNATHEEPQT